MLAEVTDPAADPDRRAWHLAQATAGADEEVAAELERSAGRAQARGRIAAAAFLERAALLTPEPRTQARRAPAAVQSMHLAGAHDADLLLDGLATGIVDGYPAGVPMLRQVVTEFRRQKVS